ncbi:MAG: two component, sigma54 specific, transcriptional regulator, Fis family [Acidobacteria bacterium]|nr:two component, sigma54 specific, transcriptional regulator, Fis family [Acidobacteriota bacterium]
MSERVILVVDDEPAQRTVLGGFLRKRGFEVAQGASVEEALAHVSARTIDLVLTDLRMPGGGGLALLEGVRAINPEIPVVVMTAFGTVATAVDAMKKGAADYLTKPIDLDELEVLIGRTLERRALVAENRELRRELETRYRLAGLETANAKMSEAINTAARAAASRATILIRGESGTGKELLARAIHHASPRSKGPLVAVNMAAVPETLVESELFGHERGAFTGADRERRGRFELADGGSLFLDEIGDLPRATQAKLLRVLQEQTFERLGGTRSLHVDARVIAATNRDLEAMVRQGEFREDLYYRLNVVTIDLPPLRSRREDIPLLVDHFLRRFAAESKAAVESVSREAMDVLLKYEYPGNVRELENIVHRAVVLARGPVVSTADLPLHVAELRSEGQQPPASFVERVAQFERELILEALERAGGVQTRAARELGMSERHLRYKLRKYGLPPAPR